MKKRIVSLFITVVLCLTTLTVLTACNSGSGTSTVSTTDVPENTAETMGDETAYQIAIVPKLMGIPYFSRAGEGAEQAGTDLGVHVIYTGPTVADATEQIKIIEDLINRGVDAICVSSNDPTAMEQVYAKARDAGIKILDWDSVGDIDWVDASVHQVDDTEYGITIMDEFIRQAGTDDMEFAILTGSLSVENMNYWIETGLQHAEENYPNLKLVTDPIPTDEVQQVAYTSTLDLITAYPNLGGILGYGSPNPLGAAQAIREKGLQDTITNVGITLEEDAQEYFEDGSLDAAVLWDPADLGRLTICVAKAVLDGTELTDGMDLEGWGIVTVYEDGKTVLKGAPEIYTKKD